MEAALREWELLLGLLLMFRGSGGDSSRSSISNSSNSREDRFGLCCFSSRRRGSSALMSLLAAGCSGSSSGSGSSGSGSSFCGRRLRRRGSFLRLFRSSLRAHALLPGRLFSLHERRSSSRSRRHGRSSRSGLLQLLPSRRRGGKGLLRRLSGSGSSSSSNGMPLPRRRQRPRHGFCWGSECHSPSGGLFLLLCSSSWGLCGFHRGSREPQRRRRRCRRRCRRWRHCRCRRHRRRFAAHRRPCCCC